MGKNTDPMVCALESKQANEDVLWCMEVVCNKAKTVSFGFEQIRAGIEASDDSSEKKFAQLSFHPMAIYHHRQSIPKRATKKSCAASLDRVQTIGTTSRNE